jgi:hypothetical protein
VGLPARVSVGGLRGSECQTRRSRGRMSRLGCTHASSLSRGYTPSRQEPLRRSVHRFEHPTPPSFYPTRQKSACSCPYSTLGTARERCVSRQTPLHQGLSHQSSEWSVSTRQRPHRSAMSIRRPGQPRLTHACPQPPDHYHTPAQTHPRTHTQVDLTLAPSERAKPYQRAPAQLPTVLP